MMISLPPEVDCDTQNAPNTFAAGAAPRTLLGFHDAPKTLIGRGGYITPDSNLLNGVGVSWSAPSAPSPLDKYFPVESFY